MEVGIMRDPVWTSASAHELAQMLSDDLVRLGSSNSQCAVLADIEYHDHRDLHERYGVEAVPIVVIVDAEGVTRASFAGTATATDLWAKVAELRA